MDSFMCLSHPHMYVRWREERFENFGGLGEFLQWQSLVVALQVSDLIYSWEWFV
jgi:hypothetical protein